MKKLVCFLASLAASILVAFAEPKKIVVLTPAGSEILCAVGAYSQIAARTDYCDFPKEMKSIPSVGGFDGKTLSLETIVAYEPDFVYGAKGMHDYLYTPLKKLGITLYLSNANSIQAVLDEITYIGKYTGHEDEGKKTAGNISKTLDNIRAKLKNVGTVSVYYEVWNAPYMSAGKNSFINEIISTAGGKNIFDTLSEEYPMVSEETIVASKPEVFLIPDMENETLDSIKKRNGWQKIPAVKSGRIYFVNSDVCSRPGPRIAEAVLLIAKQLHPEVAF